MVKTEDSPDKVEDRSMSVTAGVAERRLSLRAKGFIFTGIMVLYALSLTMYVIWQQTDVFKRFMVMQQSYSEEWDLILSDLATLNTVMVIYTHMDSFDSADPSTSRYVSDHLKVVGARVKKLVENLNDRSSSFSALNTSFEAAINNPSKHNLVSLRKTVDHFREGLFQLAVHRQKTLDGLVTDYRTTSEKLTSQVLLFGLAGMAVTIITVGLFFTRLAKDIDSLKDRAGKIVTGVVKNDGDADNTGKRQDEVGALASAIDRMALELDERERELEIERKKYFHTEKMAAIGTLAAGIAHEVGNPIAAISALVYESRKKQVAGNRCMNEACSGNMDFILRHTERLAKITREISEFSSPQPRTRQLLDLNGIVRNASRLMKYDKRFRMVNLQLNLDDDLPAVPGIGDQLLQVVMNLLINSADASLGKEGRTPTITCSTYKEDDVVILSVADNGNGMDKKTMEHAFEAFYTTKPAGKGTGLGLSLCHAIAEGHGGTIDIKSELGKGSTVRVILPLEGNEEEKPDAGKKSDGVNV